MIISIIVAASQNNAIGKDNQLPWRLPADMKYFKQTTLGHPVIMGRATYESLDKPLQGRTNIVVTRQKDYEAPGCVVAGDLKSAFDAAQKENTDECFVIGGADIIRQTLVWADRIYLTRIHHDFEGDTFLPRLNDDDWNLVKDERHLPDASNHYAYSFQVYEMRTAQ